MNEKFIRDIFYYKDYYLEFFEKLKPEVQKKFNWTLQLLATMEKVPEKYFKHITGSTGLFEVRVEVGSDIYRVFSFLIKESSSYLSMAFRKKHRKHPITKLIWLKK